MDDKRAQRIKSVVRRNFDVSADAYRQFEQGSGLFADLARRLARLARVKRGNRVLDVGCGSGDSTLVLAGVVEDGGLAVGLDISAQMLGRAGNRRGILLVQGDAHTLDCFRDHVFDAVLYNACAFLLPDPEGSFRSASGLLRHGGTLGVSVFDGIFDDTTGEDLIAKYSEDPALGLKRSRIVELSSIGPMLERAGGGAVVSETFVTPRPGLARLFHGIPAQAASLFPHLPVPERLTHVGAFFDHLESARHVAVLGWTLHVVTTAMAAP